MLDHEQLRSFVVLAGELHFGRAARRLNISQPPLSRRIQALEAFLGVDLLRRDRRSVRLTSAGRAFYPEAVAILQASEAAVRTARLAQSAINGKLAIGFIGSTTYGFLPRLVAQSRRELPHVEIVLRELTSREQVDEIAFGRIDIGFLRPIAEMREFRSRKVHREALAIALPVEHPLAPRRRIDVKALHGQPFIGYSNESPYMAERIDTLLRQQEVTPDIALRLSRAQAILSLVSIGIGAAIVPDETRLACFDNVVFRQLEYRPDADVEVHAMWRQTAENPILERFLSICGEP